MVVGCPCKEGSRLGRGPRRGEVRTPVVQSPQPGLRAETEETPKEVIVWLGGISVEKGSGNRDVRLGSAPLRSVVVDSKVQMSDLSLTRLWERTGFTFRVESCMRVRTWSVRTGWVRDPVDSPDPLPSLFPPFWGPLLLTAVTGTTVHHPVS